MAEQSFVVKTGFSGSGSNLTSIPNSALSNSAITVGSTAISLGSTATTVDGLTLGSVTLTGTPVAPTANAGTNTTQVATTAYVSTALANLVNSAPTTLDTLNELAAALGNDASFSTTITNSLAGKAPIWTNTSVSSDITLDKNNHYFVDTTSARTLTLPASPSTGDELYIYDASNNALTNNITVQPNSSKIQGSVQNLIIDSNAAAAYLIYTGSTYGWMVN